VAGIKQNHINDIMNMGYFTKGKAPSSFERNRCSSVCKQARASGRGFSTTSYPRLINLPNTLPCQYIYATYDPEILNFFLRGRLINTLNIAEAPPRKRAWIRDETSRGSVPISKPPLISSEQVRPIDYRCEGCPFPVCISCVTNSNPIRFPSVKQGLIVK
jgi:hypothetical protein